MTEHASEATLERMARRELDPESFLAAAKHLESCPACAAKARRRAAHDLGTLHRELTAPPPRRFGRASRIAAAAAAVAALAIAFFVTRDDGPTAPPRVASPPAHETTPAPATPPAAPQLAYADAAWQRLVDDARASGKLPFRADLDELHAARDAVRGESGPSQSVRPAGVVVEDARPAFTWPARGAKTCVVYVFDGEREIARSADLRAASWRPDRDLPRGRTLSWQVEAREGDAIETIPRPPAPPARFRILAEADRREIERARAQHPNDALLEAVLDARAGLREKALDMLRRVPRTKANEKLLQRYSGRS